MFLKINAGYLIEDLDASYNHSLPALWELQRPYEGQGQVEGKGWDGDGGGGGGTQSHILKRVSEVFALNLQNHYGCHFFD